MVRLVRLVSALLVAFFCGLVGASAQAGASLTFAVASIKPTPPAELETKWAPEAGGRFSARGITLKQLAALAYGVHEYQILGGAKWINAERWNIEAKAEGFPGRFNRQQLLPAMKALLEDRFQLRASMRTKVMQIYALVPARSGTRLKAPGEQAGTMSFGRGFVNGKSVSMDLLARTLSAALERPVVDRTGLSGVYEVRLEWAPDPADSGVPGDPSDLADLDPSLGSIFTAIQAELGLRLKATRGPAAVVEILEAKRPSEN